MFIVNFEKAYDKVNSIELWNALYKCRTEGLIVERSKNSILKTFWKVQLVQYSMLE